MTFSIIITVYNIEKWLCECVQSVLEQTCSDYELLLIDDGSTDGSGDICDKYAAENPNVRTIHQRNQGISATRNCGIELAQGKYILFLDGDDYWYGNECLQELYEYIKEGGFRTDVVAYQGIFHENKGKQDKIINKFYESEEQEGYLAEDFLVRHLRSNRYYNWGAWLYAFSRELFLDEKMRFPVGRRCEDIYLIWRILLSAERIGVLPVKFYVYRNIRPGSLTYNVTYAFQNDFLWVLEHCIEDVIHMEMENELKDCLLGSFSMYFVRCCAKSSFLRSKEKKKMYQKLKEKKHYLTYAYGRQYEMIRSVENVIGFYNVLRLLHLYLILEKK